MKILFPTDITEASFLAIRIILPKLISNTQVTEIILFHVVDHSNYGTTSLGNLTEKLLADATDKLFKEKEIIEAELNLEITPRVREGYFDRELKWNVEKTSPNLVVLLSKAKHGVLKYINGQKSLKFVGELAAPLLIIPAQFELKRISKMGFAIDENESPTLDTLWKVKTLSDYFKCDIKMFHIRTDRDSKADFYQHISTNMGFGDIEIVKEENVVDGILNWCEDHSIEVLITMTHSKGFFERLKTGSITRNLVRENSTSLLIITQ